MSAYQSIQDVIDTTTEDDIKSKLDEYGVKYHHKNKVETLAELLFKATGGEKKETTTKPSDAWDKIAKEVKRETGRIKKESPTISKNYISKNFNHRLKPSGLSKVVGNRGGKKIRYVEGYSTLDIAEQREQGDEFPQKYIFFRGIEGSRFEMNGFIGRGILTTSDATLQEYIESHKDYGNLFVLYDIEELEKTKLEEKAKIVGLQNGVMNEASTDDLVSVLSFLSMRNGSNNFKSLYGITNKTKLISKALTYIENDPDLFLQTIEGKTHKVIFLINLAEQLGMIKVTSDGREVKLSENNKTICHSSMSSDWQSDLMDYLLQPEGINLRAKMELKTGYKVT